MAFSPDGKILASGGDDGMTRLWDVATGRPVGNPLTGQPDRSSRWRSARTARSWPVAAPRTRSRLWDVATGRPIGNPLTGHNGPVLTVAFSPDGKILASGSEMVRAVVGCGHRPPDREPLTGTGTVHSVAFSPDGKILASGGANGTVRLWDVATRRPIGNPLTGHSDWVNSVAFSPDGKTLASGSEDGTVRLWDVATGRPIGKPLTGHSGGSIRWRSARTARPWPAAAKMARSGCGMWLPAARSGTPLLPHLVGSVAFSPDGKTLASASDDDAISFWDVTYTDNAVGYLCAAAGRSLTHAEWARWVPGLAYQDICP